MKYERLRVFHSFSCHEFALTLDAAKVWTISFKMQSSSWIPWYGYVHVFNIPCNLISMTQAALGDYCLVIFSWFQCMPKTRLHKDLGNICNCDELVKQHPNSIALMQSTHGYFFCMQMKLLYTHFTRNYLSWWWWCNASTFYFAPSRQSLKGKFLHLFCAHSPPMLYPRSKIFEIWVANIQWAALFDLF